MNLSVSVTVKALFYSATMAGVLVAASTIPTMANTVQETFSAEFTSNADNSGKKATLDNETSLYLVVDVSAGIIQSVVSATIIRAPVCLILAISYSIYCRPVPLSKV